MHRELNPYTPGAGKPPPSLAGRDTDIAAFDLLTVRNRGGRTDRGMVLHGLRGVGKTVLLNRFREHAERMSWLVIDLEGSRRPDEKGTSALKLAREFARVGRRLHRGGDSSARREAVNTIAAFAKTYGAGDAISVTNVGGRGDSGDIEIDLADVVDDICAALNKQQPREAFGLFVDEMQDIDREVLAALVAVQHRCGQRERAFYVIGAGLPDLPSRLSDLRSYAERLFDYRPIGPLDADASTAALVEPARATGASYTDEALTMLLNAAEGYPYFLQTFGKYTWDEALDKRITATDAAAGLRVGREELDGGFFPSRWLRVTDFERRYLHAMSELGEDACRTSDIATTMGVAISRLSPVRQKLIEKNVLYAPERGVVAFTVPGMRAFVERQVVD